MSGKLMQLSSKLMEGQIQHGSCCCADERPIAEKDKNEQPFSYQS